MKLPGIGHRPSCGLLFPAAIAGIIVALSLAPVPAAADPPPPPGASETSKEGTDRPAGGIVAAPSSTKAGEAPGLTDVGKLAARELLEAAGGQASRLAKDSRYGTSRQESSSAQSAAATRSDQAAKPEHDSEPPPINLAGKEGDLLLKARRLAAEGHSHEAVGEFDALFKLLEEQQHSPPSGLYAQFSKALISDRKFRRAAEIARKACRSDRDRNNDADACLELGIAYRLQDDLGDAVIAYRRALAARPHFQPALYNLGLALAKIPYNDLYRQRTDQQGESVRWITTMSGISMHFGISFHFGSPAEAAEINSLDEAIEKLHDAERLNPNDLDVPIALGIAYTYKESWADAKARFSSAQARGAYRQTMDHFFAVAWLALAFVQFKNYCSQRDCLRAALESVNTALDLQKDNPHALFLKAQIEHQQGDKRYEDDARKAIESFKRLKLDAKPATDWFEAYRKRR